MLFPKEEEYIEWFEKAGFTDVQLKKIGPKWYRGVRRHGLIMGCSVTGVKSTPGDSPLQVISHVPQSMLLNKITYSGVHNVLFSDLMVLLTLYFLSCFFYWGEG